MKILWIFPSFEIGGAQRRFASLASSLGEDCEHLVCALDGNFAARSIVDKGVQIETVPIESEKSSFLSLKNIRRFREALIKNSPDRLVTINWGSVEWRLANRPVKIPHLHIEDGFGPDEAIGGRRLKRDLARRFLFSRIATGHHAYSFVAPSRGLQEIFSSVWGVPTERVHYVPNGVDCARFMRQRIASPESTVTIGTVGALRAEKRIDRLIRVFALVRETVDARLLIVGDGPDRLALEALAAAQSCSVDITFAGSTDDVAPYLREMDIFAISSDTEQMPIGLVEAMASGLPATGTNVGDVKDMVSSDNAPFFASRNQEEIMAENIVRLANAPDRRQLLGRQNEQKAREEFSLAAMSERYREILSGLAG